MFQKSPTKKKKPQQRTAEQYQRVKDRANKASQQRILSGQDIGTIPPVKNQKRRDDARGSLRIYCETYFPAKFYLAWSSDQLKAIERIEECVIHGGLFALAMPRGSGKALALDTPLVTPDGWTTMGDVRVGDELFDESGLPCKVTFATEVQENRECYRVSFDDGESIVCCEDHLWTVNDRFSRKNPITIKTSDMAGRVVLSSRRGWNEFRYTIPVCGSLVLPPSKKEHVISPYILGAWLGDGTSRQSSITIGDKDAKEILSLIGAHEKIGSESRNVNSNCATYRIGCGRRLNSEKRLSDEAKIVEMSRAGKRPAEIADITGIAKSTIYNVRHLKNPDTCFSSVSLQARLSWLGLIKNKHIPDQYLRASEEERMSLLRGLMDTDGSISKDGSTAEYVTKVDRLRDGVMELLASLGFKRRHRPKVIDGKVYHRITFTPSDGRRVFSLKRKADRQRDRKIRISSTRRIVSIEKVKSVPVKCVQVDSPNSMYLCGKGMIPTHNTELCKRGAEWAILNGFRKLIVLIGATDELAETIMRDIKNAFSQNETLLEDFPEVCYPIWKLDGEGRRCLGQRYQGKRTNIVWKDDRIRMPDIPGSISAGAHIFTRGITGAVRGLSVSGSRGETIRPDLVFPDDVQTRQSAMSLTQTAGREITLSGDVLELAGPDKKMAAVMPCTVIQVNDLAQRFLDRSLHPEWRGEKFQAVYQFPTRIDLWEKYAELRRDSLRHGGTGKEATDWYRLHFEDMNEGAIVGWEGRKKPDELSALQSAMNVKIDKPDVFAAEWQNEPIPPDQGISDSLTVEQVLEKCSGMPRGIVPRESTRITSFIDVHLKMFVYGVAAFDERFGCHVLDYGSFPRQHRGGYDVSQAQPSLADTFPGLTETATIYQGLTSLCNILLSQQWRQHETNALMSTDAIMIDVGYQAETIFKFIRESGHGSQIIPSKGYPVLAKHKPMHEWPKKTGQRQGFNWRLYPAESQKGRWAIVDVNSWKSFLADRVRVAAGTHGSFSIFGKPEENQHLAEHFTAEKRTVVSHLATGRTKGEWTQTPSAPNHLFDVFVGCCVAASVSGLQWQPDAGLAVKRNKTPKMSLDELAKRGAEMPIL